MTVQPALPKDVARKHSSAKNHPLFFFFFFSLKMCKIKTVVFTL